MELFPEYEVQDARPRRHIRPPVRYADYEVDHLGYTSRRWREEDNLDKYVIKEPRDCVTFFFFSSFRQFYYSQQDTLAEEFEKKYMY